MNVTFFRCAIAAGVVGGALLLAAAVVRAEDDIVYRWVDDQGSAHFTQGRENIPAPYRTKAVPLGSVFGEQSQPPPTPGQAGRAPEHVPPPPAAPPASPRQPPPPGAPERVALDELLEKAQTTDQYLVLGGAYLSLGLPLAAKTCANKAAAVARTSGEWARLADAYAALGETAASGDARGRSDQLRQQERALQTLPR
jgi:hypothetical protein